MDWVDSIAGGKTPHYYNVERTIWRDQLLPDFRVAIPENTLKRESSGVPSYMDIQTRVLVYIPTGRQIYDNNMPHQKALLFEYELEQYRAKKNKI
jgi:hypothetical protein